jgi:hypothetical protein
LIFEQKSKFYKKTKPKKQILNLNKICTKIRNQEKPQKPLKPAQTEEQKKGEKTNTEVKKQI